MVLLELLEDQHHHQMTSIRKIKKINFGVLSGPRVGLASVNIYNIYYTSLNFSTYIYLIFFQKQYLAQLHFVTKQSICQFLPFFLNSPKPGLEPKSLVPDWLRRSKMKVFVSQQAGGEDVCICGSEQIGFETVVKNNGERIIL